MKKFVSMLKDAGEKSANAPIAMASPPRVMYIPKVPKSLKNKTSK